MIIEKDYFFIVALGATPIVFGLFTCTFAWSVLGADRRAERAAERAAKKAAKEAAKDKEMWGL